MEPARTIISLLGGIPTVASVTGIHRTGVWKWTQSRDVGGTGGTVPLKHIAKLLAEAERRGVALSADDFIPKEAAE